MVVSEVLHPSVILHPVIGLHFCSTPVFSLALSMVIASFIVAVVDTIVIILAILLLLVALVVPRRHDSTIAIILIVLLPLAPLSRSANRLHSSLFSNFLQRNFFNLAYWHHNHGLDLLLLRLFHIEIILSRHLSRSRLIGFVSMALPFLKKLCNRIFLSIYLIQLLYLRF